MKKFCNPEILLFVYLVFLLVLGLIIVPDFGRSTDESPESLTASIAYKMMTGDFFENPDPKELYTNLPRRDQYYGTASTVIFQFVEKVLFSSKDHGTKIVSHYCYYLFFLLSIIGIYVLGNNFFNSWIALVIAVLYGTQPLLFGHAFINPKDIPLLSVFTLTVVFGISMVNRWTNSQNDTSDSHLALKTKSQRIFVIVLLLIFCLTWLSPEIIQLAVKVVKFGLTNKESILGKILSSIITSGSLQGYLDLTTIYLLRGFRLFFLIVPVIIIYLFWIVGKNKIFGSYVNLSLLAASAMWGFSISTRIIAFAAGGFVGIYALLKIGKKAVFLLGIYSLMASIISFLTWPFLWVSGLKGILGSIAVFSDYPWMGKVFFEGQYYLPHDLPWRYLPKLLSIQFTEPMVILAIVGLFLSIYIIFSRSDKRLLHIILFLWFFPPILYIIIAKATIYNNFRHFLFITPPMFIYAGITLSKILPLLKKQVFKILFCILIIFPGIIALVAYHPYEYIYYNSFVGGISGASDEYELDYWNIAYKEAMDYINAVASGGSKILVWKNNLLGEIYADEDKSFVFGVYSNDAMPEIFEYDFALVPMKFNIPVPAFDSYEKVFVVEVDAAKLLGVVKIDG